MLRSGDPADRIRPVLIAAERFARAVEARSISLMLELDLTMPALRTLMTLRRVSRANGRQLAAALRLTPGAIVAICDHLERRGYVRRVVDTRDRRITWFVLTEEGTVALRPPAAYHLARTRTKMLVAGLTPREREGFIKVANAFADALDAVVGPRRSEALDRADVGE